MTRSAASAEAGRLLDAELGDLPDAAAVQAWGEAVVRWVLGRHGFAPFVTPNRSARLQLLQVLVDQHPHRDRLLERMTGIWEHTSAVRLLSEMGLPDHPSFVTEAFQRVTDRWVPRLDPHEDLYALVDRLRITEEEARWLEMLPDELRQPWAAVVSPSLQSFGTAAELLAVRAAALGLSRDLLLRQPEVTEADSPFLALPQATRHLSRSPDDAPSLAAWKQIRAGCEETVQAMFSRLDDHGVSTEVVYRLELVRASLRRMDALLALASGRGDGFRLTTELVRGSVTQHSLRDLLRVTLRRLALKVVEHTAQTGEHYIANTRAAWWGMLGSAAGGGALTAITAFLKHGLMALPLAPALMGVAHTLNYAASFVVLQLLGFSLASKQPAMTGSALADALDHESDQDALVDLVASIARTQLISAIGNVCLAIPCALLLDLTWRLLTGQPFLAAHEGEHGLAELHPLRTLTLPFAALTGVFLWISSLAAGLSANFSAFRSLPKAVARSPGLRSFLGERRTRWLGIQVHRHFSGVVASLVLGFLLGFVPVLFKFVGLGIEVRHVTLSAAALALNASALFSSGALHVAPLLWAGVGVVAIGALNFGVSFALALRVALQARGLAALDRRRLLRGILRALIRTPGRFLFPPKG